MKTIEEIRDWLLDNAVDETGLWRVSLPDDITGGNNNF